MFRTAFLLAATALAFCPAAAAQEDVYVVEIQIDERIPEPRFVNGDVVDADVLRDLRTYTYRARFRAQANVPVTFVHGHHVPFDVGAPQGLDSIWRLVGVKIDFMGTRTSEGRIEYAVDIEMSRLRERNILAAREFHVRESMPFDQRIEILRIEQDEPEDSTTRVYVTCRLEREGRLPARAEERTDREEGMEARPERERTEEEETIEPEAPAEDLREEDLREEDLREEEPRRAPEDRRP